MVCKETFAKIDIVSIQSSYKHSTIFRHYGTNMEAVFAYMGFLYMSLCVCFICNFS